MCTPTPDSGIRVVVHTAEDAQATARRAGQPWEPNYEGHGPPAYKSAAAK